MRTAESDSEGYTWFVALLLFPLTLATVCHATQTKPNILVIFGDDPAVPEERRAGNPHAAFRENRRRVTAFGDPVADGRNRVSSTRSGFSSIDVALPLAYHFARNGRLTRWNCLCFKPYN